MNRNREGRNRGAPPTQRGGGGQAPASSPQGAKYPLPKDLVTLYRAANKSTLNPALIFDRFAPDLSKAGSRKEDWKKEALKVAAIKPDSSVLKAYTARWRALVSAAGAEAFQMTTDWRFIPGLGRKSALEIGFNFHRCGFPCLPGSAVKGIARTWALFELVESLQLSEEGGEMLNTLDQLLAKPETDFKKKLEEQPWDILNRVQQQVDDFRAVFGTLEAAGGAIFFEAIPQEAFALEVDIMNPHYGPYYQGKEPPADWHNPVPVGFLAVPAGKVFYFAVGWRMGAARPADLLPKAKQWLKKGLQELGAGAKTAAGYGYFK